MLHYNDFDSKQKCFTSLKDSKTLQQTQEFKLNLKTPLWLHHHICYDNFDLISYEKNYDLIKFHQCSTDTSRNNYCWKQDSTISLTSITLCRKADSSSKSAHTKTKVKANKLSAQIETKKSNAKTKHIHWETDWHRKMTR